SALHEDLAQPLAARESLLCERGVELLLADESFTDEQRTKRWPQVRDRPRGAEKANVGCGLCLFGTVRDDHELVIRLVGRFERLWVQLARIHPVDRRPHLVLWNHGEAERCTEVVAEILGEEDGRRIGDGDEVRTARERADRERLEAAREILVQTS